MEEVFAVQKTINCLSLIAFPQFDKRKRKMAHWPFALLVAKSKSSDLRPLYLINYIYAIYKSEIKLYPRAQQWLYQESKLYFGFSVISSLFNLFSPQSRLFDPDPPYDSFEAQQRINCYDSTYRKIKKK